MFMWPPFREQRSAPAVRTTCVCPTQAPRTSLGRPFPESKTTLGEAPSMKGGFAGTRSKRVLTGRHFMLGNPAVVEGALAAGCDFFAGYPITPAYECHEWMTLSKLNFESL